MLLASKQDARRVEADFHPDILRIQSQNFLRIGRPRWQELYVVWIEFLLEMRLVEKCVYGWNDWRRWLLFLLASTPSTLVLLRLTTACAWRRARGLHESKLLLLLLIVLTASASTSTLCMTTASTPTSSLTVHVVT